MKKLYLILCCIFLMSCRNSASLKNISNPQQNVSQLEQVQSFSLLPLKRIRLPSVTAFLWKPQASPFLIAQALRAIRTMDENEALAFHIQTLQEQLEKMPEESSLLSQWAQLEKQYGPAKTLLEKIEKETPEKLSILSDAADLWETANSPSFVFAADTTVNTNGKTSPRIKATIYDVIFPGDSVKDNIYSTDLGSISEVQYSQRGSEIKFTVLANYDPKKGPMPLEKHVYFFSLRRTDYGDKSGRQIYKGDILYQTLGARDEILKELRGQIKLSDRAN